MNKIIHNKIANAISTGGPISVARYMSLCMSTPDHGYYHQDQVIGKKGDFITAPEISQMFGELIGVWCVAAWHMLGRPFPFNLIELGPGNGTLMADFLRACRVDADFLAAVNIYLIEISEPAIKQQKKKLAQHIKNIKWYNKLAHVPEGPFLLIANELLDVLPVHQYIKTDNGWREQLINLDVNNLKDLHFVTGKSFLDTEKLPVNHDAILPGTIFEISPARESLIREIAQKIITNKGAALIIDYGYDETMAGSTLQAVKNHEFVDPLNQPGLADLTAHVDFQALFKVAKQIGACPSPIISQGNFLNRMGLKQRLHSLTRNKDRHTVNSLYKQSERLSSPLEMGTLFKVMAIAEQKLSLPPYL